MENKKEFFHNKSGSKLRISYLKKNPIILKEIEDWSNLYNLNELTLSEKIYHFVNDLTELPYDKNGLKKVYRGFSKGYSVNGKIQNIKKNIKLEDLLIYKDLQKTGGSISQKIMNNFNLLIEVQNMYKFDISDRAKIYMFVNDLTEPPKCKICNNYSKFGNSRGFLLTCSNKCRRNLESKYRSKFYIMKDGRSVRVQGYEHFVLNELEKLYKSSDILVSDEIYKHIDIIKYLDNKEYYPDIFIISENKIIEVKSNYTYRKDYEKNQLKKEASINAGYKFEFYIWDLKQII